MIKSFKDQDIDILNLNDQFFNDVCIPYSNSGNDMKLNERIKELYKNYTFCEKNCQLNNINYENKPVTCN